MGYVIIETGYEGIEEIIGLFDADAAIKKIKSLRKRHRTKADFYCVQKVDKHGAKCACSELVVKPSKPMLR